MNEPQSYPMPSTAAMEEHIVTVHKFTIKEGDGHPTNRVYTKTIGNVTCDFICEKGDNGWLWIKLVRVSG
jgi:hypothetical protein